ncbi:MAG TPA: hypothetical protein VE007_03450 [Thermoanaerobaculia bacterium]|nr:hypothetical protein [Thermoanaerobaculia bacterium]
MTVSSEDVIAASLLCAILLAGPPAPVPTQPPTRLTLRNGTVYMLREPPRISGARVVFTTLDGRTFTMEQSEIEAVGAAPRPTATPRRYDSGDSHALGAIARQQRDRRGKKAEVAPRQPAVRRPTPTPRHPRRHPSPAGPAAGKTSPG